jgi:dTDP-4-dehydrorhamnose 3,5-epimerase
MDYRLEITPTSLAGVLVIKPYVFEDHRGEFVETYNERIYREHGIDVQFVQDDISVSTRGVLRGIHGDSQTCKLLSCLHGKLYFVVVNCDAASKDFGKWQSFILSDASRLQVLVPPKHGNGYLVLSDKAVFHYKQSTYYNRAGQFTYKWDDPRLGIWWPVKDPILSERDETGK